MRGQVPDLVNNPLLRIGRKMLGLGLATPRGILCSVMFMVERFLPGRKDRIARRLKRVRRRGPSYAV